MTKILVTGSVNLDLSARVARLPQPGETVSGATLSRFPGGKGANQAVAASRLGADVSLIARVGDDAFAGEALQLLREAGVDLSGLQTSRELPTGIALISVAHSGENQIVVAPGANRELSATGVELPEADALICQLEVPADTIAHVAASFEGFFCANLAPAKEVDVAVLQRADLIVVNEVESAWYGDTLSACRGLVATTFGAAGAHLARGGETLARVPAPRVNTVDTVGAGDCFTAALTLALVEGQDAQEALRFACAAGALATTKPGAQPGMPLRAEVESMLESEGAR